MTQSSKVTLVFHFSMKTLILAVGIVGIACGVMFGSPGQTNALMGYTASHVLVAMLGGLLVFDRRYGRAFAVGALPSLLVVLYMAFFNDQYFYSAHGGWQSELAALTLAMVMCGFTTMFVFRTSDAGNPSTTGGSNAINELVAGLILGLILASVIGICADYFGAFRQASPIPRIGGVL